ncbi:hypothetical protein HJD18_08175 [Thermoleophilia bacterium SCSIO 60948]|nr:hypothetical protein HJD18_08175 [Thermoleophilia bacterium SCSIO 60948]
MRLVEAEAAPEERAHDDLDELLREAMVACRKAEDAIYEARDRDLRRVERCLGSMARLVETHLGMRRRERGVV